MSRHLEVLKIVKDAIDHDLSERPLEKEPDSCKEPKEWYDQTQRAQSAEVAGTGVQSSAEAYPYSASLLRVIARALGHTAANPSAPGNNRALGSLFTFPKPPPLKPWLEYDLAECECPNGSIADVKQFSKKLIEASQAHRRACVEKFYGRTSPNVDTTSLGLTSGAAARWILIGDRGIGKTIFLNYLLGGLNKRFHDGHVIWFRIDLTKPHDRVASIEEWLRWKYLYVVFNYYDRDRMLAEYSVKGKESPHCRHWNQKEKAGLIFDLSSKNDKLYNMVRYFLPEYLEDREKYNAEFERFRERMRSSETIPPKQGEPIPDTSVGTGYRDLLFDAIAHYLMIEHNVGMLAVVDGLDRLGLSESQQQDFENRAIQVLSIACADSIIPISCPFIVTMRRESFKWAESLQNHYARTFQKAIICPVPSTKIWERKKKYACTLKNFKSEYYEPINKLEPKPYSTQVEAFCDAFILFASLCMNSTGKPATKIEKEEHTAFEKLELLFGLDRRQLFHALKTVADFLVHRISGDMDATLWSLVAAEEISHVKSPSIAYELTRDPYGRLRHWTYLFVEALMLEDVRNEMRTELDSYDYQQKEDGKVEFRHRPESSWNLLYNVFHQPYLPGISKDDYNVLLPVRLLQTMNAFGEACSERDLRHVLERYFGYAPWRIGFLISEMKYEGMIENRVFKAGYIDGAFRLGNKGRFILDQLLSKVEYLNLALQSCPLPTNFVKNGVFPVQPYESEEYVVKNKIIAVVNFCRYLGEIEEIEIERFNRNYDGMYDENTRYNFYSFRGASFEIVPEMKKGAIDEISRIMRDAYGKAASRSRVLGQLENIRTGHWKFHGLA